MVENKKTRRTRALLHGAALLGGLALLTVFSSRGQTAIRSINLVPASPITVENCIPFGNNTLSQFSGFIYRNVPPFRLKPGAKLRFDLGAENDVEIRRDLYLSVANVNPAAYDGNAQGVEAVQWVKVAHATGQPANPRGNGQAGDYELTFVVDEPFDFPGGGLIVGVSGIVPPEFEDNTCANVMVCTTSADASGNFYGRFFGREELPAGPLDADAETFQNRRIGGMIIEGIVEDLPVAVADSAITAEDTPVSINVLANDNGTDLAVTEVSAPAHGTVQNAGGGVLVYTPAPNFFGSDSFAYTASSPSGAAVAEVSLVVTAVNDAPAIAAESASVSVEEGETAKNRGTWGDIDNSAAEMEVRATTGIVNRLPDGTWEWTHQTVDGPADGTTVRVTARDGFGAETSTTFVLDVANVGPVYTAPAGQSVDEGSQASLELGSFADPGNDAPWKVDVQWGDGESSQLDAAAAGTLPARSHQYLDNGTYVVNVSVTDKDGALGAGSFPVEVRNVAPVVTAPAAQTGAEGAPASFDLGSFTDPGPDSPWSVTVEWGDGSSSTLSKTETGALGTAQHAYADNGTYTVNVSVSDNDGGLGSASFQVTVDNAAPAVQITGPASGALGAVNMPINLTGSVSDTGTADTHTAVWVLRNTAEGVDFTQSVPGVVDPVTDQVTGTFTPSIPGVYSITLQVTDDDGASVSADHVAGLPAFVVVFDPSAAFVTGGGWLWSPAGAFPANPLSEGKLSFGFVARYKKDALVPEGDMEFQFKAGDLKFRSKDYQWLLVSGARAQCTGEGALNGVEGYRFLLTTVDGQATGGGGYDRLRLKVWNAATGVVVYDNQPGSADDAGLADWTIIRGGSIVIHNK